MKKKKLTMKLLNEWGIQWNIRVLATIKTRTFS